MNASMNAANLKAAAGTDKFKGILAKLASQQNGGRNRLNSGKKVIPRKKFIEGETYIQIIPACLALPFNPSDLEDDSFNTDRRFIFAGMSVYAGILLLKGLMAQDEALAEYVADWLGVSVSNLNLDDLENVSEKEQSLYMKWRTAEDRKSVV